MIEFKSLAVTFGKKSVLKDVNLTARDGEITVLLGRNGSGKTTLFNSVFSTRGGTFSGEIYIDGVAREELSCQERSLAVSLLPQTLPEVKMSVTELVSLGRSAHAGFFGVLSEEDKVLVELSVKKLGLDGLKERSLSTLSGGELRRAYLAMLTAKNTKNLLLDEPTSALDAPSARELSDFVRDAKREGRCVLLITHDLTSAVELADAIYVFCDGSVSEKMTAEEFCTSGFPERIFSETAYKISRDGTEKTVFLPLT